MHKGIDLHNKLPNELKNENSLNKFKEQLNKYVFMKF